MDLVERCNRFIEELDVPVTKFCNHILLSRSCFYHWKKGELRLAQTTLDRIDAYLTRYGF